MLPASTVMQTAQDSSTAVRVFEGTVSVGPSDALKKAIKEKKVAPPGEPTEVPGPEEVPGPYEVTLEQWRSIVAGQQISVRTDGKVSNFHYKECLTFPIDTDQNFWYNIVVQIGSGNITALIVAVIREGG